MSAQDHLSGLQFEHYQNAPMGHTMRALHEGTEIGRMEWVTPAPEGMDQRRPAGTILKAQVSSDWQRKGVATEMLNRAREIHPEVHHATTLTDMGSAWAKARP